MGRQADTITRQDESGWPYASLLLCGLFGIRSPGALAYSARSILAAVVMGLSLAAVTQESPPLLPAEAWALMLPASAAAIALAVFRYLRRLDELTRTIQLQALAVGYGTAVILGMALLGLLLIAPAGTAAGLHPTVWLVPLLVAETARGVALVVFARRYG